MSRCKCLLSLFDASTIYASNSSYEDLEPESRTTVKPCQCEPDCCCNSSGDKSWKDELAGGIPISSQS